MPSTTKRLCFKCDDYEAIPSTLLKHWQGKMSVKCGKSDDFFRADGYTHLSRRVLFGKDERAMKPSAWEREARMFTTCTTCYGKPRFGKTDTTSKGESRASHTKREKSEKIHIPLITGISEESAAAEAGLIQCFEPKVVTRNGQFEYVSKLPTGYKSHAQMHETLLRILKSQLDKQKQPFTSDEPEAEGDIDSCEDFNLYCYDDLLAETEERVKEKEKASPSHQR